MAEAAAALAELAAALSLWPLHPDCFSPQFHWLWHSFRWSSLPSGWTLR
ncbi:hypothetical protein AC99_5352 [Escherichia coli 2-222-05_S4_C2]|nr:hypothetical protein AC99_5352 [Escherichia coli 2-222-05_S4_C2]